VKKTIPIVFDRRDKNFKDWYCSLHLLKGIGDGR
jgi:hypothetical protein